MSKNIEFKMSNAPNIRGKLREQVIRRFVQGVQKEMNAGESLIDIFNHGSDDPYSRWRALQIAGKINAALHCGHGPTIWAATFQPLTGKENHHE